MCVRKRLLYISLLLLLVVTVLCAPPFPWSARFRHKLDRVIVKSEMTLAGWRGYKPRLISISGRVAIPGAQIQAVDSRSGWATLADAKGRFVLPDVMWYPGATYEIVTSTGDDEGWLTKVTAPKQAPESGEFDIGELNLDLANSVPLADLPGINSITYEDYDNANQGYYRDLFDRLTSEKESDEQRIDALDDYVAAKLNYEATQWGPGSPRQVLEQGTQYCGHLSTAMATLLATANYKTRRVNVSDGQNPPGTHVVVEVLYEGQWHLYDPTYGIKFQNREGKVASYKDVRLDPGLIKEDLLTRVEPKKRREVFSLLLGVYGTGYHHFYYFK